MRHYYCLLLFCLPFEMFALWKVVSDTAQGKCSITKFAKYVHCFKLRLGWLLSHFQKAWCLSRCLYIPAVVKQIIRQELLAPAPSRRHPWDPQKIVSMNYFYTECSFCYQFILIVLWTLHDGTFPITVRLQLLALLVLISL